MRASPASMRYGDRSALARSTLAGLAVLLALSMLASLLSGATGAPSLTVLLDIVGLGSDDPALYQRDRTILLTIRLPRMALGMLVGAALAVSGLVMQGLFRNPLADPGLVGVSAGASLGAVSFIVLGTLPLFAPLVALFGFYALQFSAFVGGLVTTAVLYAIATRHGQTSIATMLLAGIALAAMAGAMTGLLIYMANDAQLRDLTFWGLGSLAGANWARVLGSAPIILVALCVTGFLAKGLNALTLGEAAALHMGIEVQRTKHIAIVSVAAAIGAAVAVSGGIGFVGIVVPHLLRLVIGPDNRYLIPASALLGASFLLIADAVSRVIVAPSELPIGIVTAAVGGPFFLWVLLRRRHGMGW